ncbi:hypothetical protein GCM10010339_66000 [Streptomyces alanosinicus]|uniref:Uncharacterized protein n=1 Tax=Streptomyces alanosinicus TaxID=68171 RepID=A0A919D699_9ACTN|nr:hypothetical protein GCM10010339_66000 [Streptomyces alanosinicus]
MPSRQVTHARDVDQARQSADSWNQAQADGCDQHVADQTRLRRPPGQSQGQHTRHDSPKPRESHTRGPDRVATQGPARRRQQQRHARVQLPLCLVRPTRLARAVHAHSVPSATVR